MVNCISKASNNLAQEAKRLISFVKEVLSHMSRFAFTYEKEKLLYCSKHKVFYIAIVQLANGLMFKYEGTYFFVSKVKTFMRHKIVFLYPLDIFCRRYSSFLESNLRHKVIDIKSFCCHFGQNQVYGSVKLFFLMSHCIWISKGR